MFFFFFKEKAAIGDLVRSRGLGVVYKRQIVARRKSLPQKLALLIAIGSIRALHVGVPAVNVACLLYTSDAADERSSVDLGGRRIIKKKKTTIAKSHSAT